MADNKDKKVLNVPHLRFPEFSGEWEKCSIQDYGEVVTGNTPPTSHAEYYEDGSYLWASPADLGINKNITETKTKLSLSGFKKTRSIPKGSVLVTCIGSTIGKMGMAAETMSSNQQINSIVVNDKSNSDFVYYAICRAFPRYLSEVAVQAVPILSKSNFEKLPNYTTCRDEQDKIGYFLNLLDERIATQNKIIEDLKLLRDAITERLYSEVNGTVYTYHQLFDVINERNKDNVYNNVLSASQELGMIDRSDINIDIKFEQASIVSYKIVRKGDYVVHLRSFQGGFAFSEKTGICSPAYTILRPNDNLIYGYLSHYFTSKQFVKSLKLVTYGIRDGRSINVDEWLDMKVAIPEKQVQSHILTTINSIGCRLRNEDKIYSRLIKQKSYLLRQMFI